MKFATLSAATGALALLVLPATAHAQTPLLAATVFSDPTALYLDTAESYLVLDFEDGNLADTYAFGYLYDPSTSQTGLTMIDALQAAVPGFTADPIYDASFGEYYVNSFSYNGLSDNDFSNTGYWSYYNSDTSQFTPLDYSGYSVDARPLTNGSYDGWAWDTGSDPLPVTPLANSAVPEAGSCWLVLAALPLAWVVRRRAQRQQRALK